MKFLPISIASKCTHHDYLSLFMYFTMTLTTNLLPHCPQLHTSIISQFNKKSFRYCRKTSYLYRLSCPKTVDLVDSFQKVERNKRPNYCSLNPRTSRPIGMPIVTLPLHNNLHFIISLILIYTNSIKMY